MPPEGPSKPYRRHERGLLRPDGKPGFNTPSGKIEVYNETYKSWGLDPLPFYTEPPQSAVSTPELFKKYPLVMITGARSQLYFHAEHRMIPWLREKMPDPYVEIHPDTAKKYGIYDGEWVYLENDMGQVKRKAAITLKVKPHHVNTMHGWWLPELDGREPSLFGVWDYQINKIIPGPQCSKSGFGGGQYKTTLCTLRKTCGMRKHPWPITQSSSTTTTAPAATVARWPANRNTTIQPAPTASWCANMNTNPMGGCGSIISRSLPSIATCARRAVHAKHDGLPACVKHCQSRCMEFGRSAELRNVLAGSR